jgi:DNA-binding NtrC family response regulator
MQKILILDDEKNIRLTIKRCLETPEMSIDDAINGEEALKKLKDNSYDLLLLDLKLPGIDGMEILKIVRNQYPDMKVIIISAHGTIQTAVEALKTGALDFLEKPFTPGDLRLVIQKALLK